ncbi:L-asparaginase precursor [Serratia plymuthica]|uniref:L-asparaginase n=1 Tax=Serratia plymuthica TaxID=82996 RepID=A0A2X4UWS5_SERPL|nr:L-asparaginase precursor [Serratia plymuthica]
MFQIIRVAFVLLTLGCANAATAAGSYRTSLFWPLAVPSPARQPPNTQTTGYKAGALGVDTLIAAVPEMQKSPGWTASRLPISAAKT